MEERKTSNQTRNSSNKNAVVSKKANVVRKNINKSVSPKRVSSMHAVKKVMVETKRKEDRQPFPWSIVVVATLFTTLFLFMMMNYAEVDKYRNEIASLDSKIATMQKNQDELEVTLNNKYDLTEIREYASEQLGMVPGNQISNRKIITIDQGDRIEMHKYDDGEEGGFGFLLSGLGEVIRDFIN